MLTSQDYHNLLVLINVGMQQGAYNIEHTPVIAVLARKLSRMKKELDASVQDSTTSSERSGEESPALVG